MIYYMAMTPDGYMLGTSREEVERQKVKIGSKAVRVIDCDSQDQVLQLMSLYTKELRSQIILPDKPVLGKPTLWEREIIRINIDFKHGSSYTAFNTGRVIVRFRDGRECEYPNHRGKSKGLPIVKELQALVGCVYYYDFKGDEWVKEEK